MTLTAEQIKEQEAKVAAEKAAAEEEAKKKAAEDAAKGGDGKGNEDDDIKIPFYKFQKANEETKQLKAKLDEIEKEKAKQQQEKLIEEGKYKELVAAKDAEIQSLQSKLSVMTENIKKFKVTSIVKDEVAKFNPRDINDVLALIDMASLEIQEEGENITVKGVKDLLEKLKKQKDYLFGAAQQNKNDNKNENENGKPASGSLESLEAEYRLLLSKERLTGAEQRKLNDLAAKLKELRDKKQ